MNKQEDKSEKDKLSDSDELFESIFRKAMSGEEKQKTEKPKLGKDRRPNQVRPKAETPLKSKPPVVSKKSASQASKPTPEPQKVKREAPPAAEKSSPPVR